MEHAVLPYPQLGGFCHFPLRLSPASACVLALGQCQGRSYSHLFPLGHMWLGVPYTEGLGNESPAHLWGLTQALGKEEQWRP